MAYGRVSMRKTREILRLKFEARLSHRQIGRACGVSCSTVSEAVGRFQAAGLSWPLPAELPDSALEARLYREHGETARDTREPDWQHVHKELARAHVTLAALWGEYKKVHPDGYQYSWFCAAYRAWAAKIDVVMRFQHKAGEKLFIDWAGDTVPIVDPASGEVRPAYLFVAVLGASSYTYVEAALSQDSEAFLAAHVRAFEFYGGCVRILVPDNLKTGVQKTDRYEPTINRAYADLAAHYGAAVIPARVCKPRDKAKVENAVLFSYRALLVPLRDRVFFSLPELNAALSEQLRLLNERPFQKLDGSRRSVFLELDAPALLPLPAEPYGCHTRKRARVHIDYHVELERHCYSVPYQLAREEVEIVFSASLVEVFHDGQRVASHVRSGRRGGFTTDPAHMPAAHREVASWTPERMEAWAAKTGPATEALVTAIMAARAHPAQGFRSCLGVLRLGDKHGAARLEAACARALTCGGRSYKSVKSILEKHLESVALPEGPAPPAPAVHENVRGAGYYT